MKPMSPVCSRLILAAAALAVLASHGRAEVPDLSSVRSVLLGSGLIEPEALGEALYQRRGTAKEPPERLLEAVESRQRLSRLLAERAHLLSKDVQSKTHGTLDGFGASFFFVGGVSVSGSFDQTVYDNLLKGGRIFAVSTGLGPKARAFLKELDPRPTYPCATALRERLHQYQPTPGPDAFAGELATFRNAMNALELTMVGREGEPSYKTFSDLRDWARSTYLAKYSLEAKDYEFIDGASMRPSPDPRDLAGVRFFGAKPEENFRCVHKASAQAAIAGGFLVVADYSAMW